MKLEVIKGLAVLTATSKKDSEKIMLFYLGKSPAEKVVKEHSTARKNPYLGKHRKQCSEYEFKGVNLKKHFTAKHSGTPVKYKKRKGWALKECNVCHQLFKNVGVHKKIVHDQTDFSFGATKGFIDLQNASTLNTAIR